MKKTILLTTILFITLTSFGQNKRTTTPIGWYSYIKSSQDIGHIYTRRITTLFPDSTLFTRIQDGLGNDTSGNTNLHSIGQAFDPKYGFYVEPDSLSATQGYIVDSIRIYYQYNHSGDSTSDTLRIQFFQNAQVQDFNFPNEGRTYSVRYDAATNGSISPNFSREIILLLDSSDDTKGQFISRAIAIPGGGLNVNAGKHCAFTMSFKPGYAHDSGDTIDHYYNPVKKLNQFIPSVLVGKPGTPYHTANVGLFALKSQRYAFTPNEWPNHYVPGDVFYNHVRYFQADFYLIFAIDNIPKVSSISAFSIYPNPSNNLYQLNIDFELTQQEELTVTITDITGRVLKEISATDYRQGKNTIKADITGLNAGMYYVNIISSSGGRTAKPIIMN